MTEPVHEAKIWSLITHHLQTIKWPHYLFRPALPPQRAAVQKFWSFEIKKSLSVEKKRPKKRNRIRVTSSHMVVNV